MTVQLQLGSATVKLEGPGSRVFVGRDHQVCQLAFMDPTLSRRHAEVWLDNGQALLRDLGSANGTWVDGRHIGAAVVALRPNQQIWLGHVPLGVVWPIDGSRTALAQQIPPELAALIAAHKQRLQQQLGPGASMSMAASVATAPLAPAASGVMPASASGSMSIQAGGASTPLPSEFAYRRQGANDNGVLLLALRQDTFFNGTTIEGYVEFTATDSETVASIFVDLVELERGGPVEGHVWDRCLVRQGPWKAQNGDVLPLPFQLRVPAGTTATGPDVYWEIRGEVDINWASDIEAKIGINMRNQDMERIRDGLGAMDYRLGDMKSVAKGQRYEADFFPPANLAKQWGINDIRLEMEYLGANLKLRMKVDRKGAFKKDPEVEQVFELGRLRAASQADVNLTLEQMLKGLLAPQ